MKRKLLMRQAAILHATILLVATSDSIGGVAAFWMIQRIAVF